MLWQMVTLVYLLLFLVNTPPRWLSICLPVTRSRWPAPSSVLLPVLKLRELHYTYRADFRCQLRLASDGGRREYYVSVEHVNVTYVNPEYGYVNATALRPGRWDYKHYVRAYVLLLKTVDNEIKVDFHFYEFRSNEYRRGFVEMHFKLCDLILNDFFFGPALRANLPGCPLPPGEYRLYNMSIPDLPLLRTFPFRKGRIYTNVTHGKVNVGNGFVDGDQTEAHAEEEKELTVENNII